jgi:diguanylate cyclase (GGDEF)-like protein/PAS domain S-box-containing protein
MEASYRPLVEYLNQTVSEVNVKLRVLTQVEMEQALENGELDFVFTNPSHFVLLRYHVKLSGAIATLVRLEKSQAVSMLGGVIFTSQSHPEIQSLQDLKGRTLAVPGMAFLGGYQTQAYELLQEGIRLPDDMATVTDLGNHDDVVRAVLAGKADVGFVRTSVIESMISEKKIDPSDLKIINPKSHPGFPFLVSTKLYPEWAFATISGRVSNRLQNRLAAALLLIEPESDLAKTAGIAGFTVPGDYLPVENLARTLRLPPFEKAPAFTATDVMSRWSWQIAISLSVAMLIGWLSLQLFVTRRQIKRQRDVERMHLAVLGEGVFGVDNEDRCTFINPAALAMLGYAEHEVIGKNRHLLFHHHHFEGQTYPDADCPISQSLHSGVALKADDWFIRKDGSGFHVRLVATSLEMDGKRIGAEVAFQDISERKALEEKLQIMAIMDVSTGLPNRRHFFQRMNEELARLKRRDESDACILMLDLDHFKNINDTYGHAAGDAVLKHFASLLQKDLRESDLAGRIGGEEFAIAMPDCTLNSAMERAERLRKLVESGQVTHEDAVIHYTVSIGLTQFFATDAMPEVALARADAALYRAKERRNSVST